MDRCVGEQQCPQANRRCSEEKLRATDRRARWRLVGLKQQFRGVTLSSVKLHFCCPSGNDFHA
eukprot:SAG11_NODE_23040_length_396_cov_0.696970_1_plen_62_part_10